MELYKKAVELLRSYNIESAFDLDKYLYILWIYKINIWYNIWYNI